MMRSIKSPPPIHSSTKYVLSGSSNTSSNFTIWSHSVTSRKAAISSCRATASLGCRPLRGTRLTATFFCVFLFSHSCTTENVPIPICNSFVFMLENTMRSKAIICKRLERIYLPDFPSCTHLQRNRHYRLLQEECPCRMREGVKS
jgi:hypothetical protein